jgi:hypothetical protein
MKKIPLITVMLVIFFISCSEQENTITPILPENQTPFYLGKIGTQRVYEEIKKWYVPNTDSPFIYVPDSLKSRVQFTFEELAQGIVQKSEMIQRVDSIDYSYYTYWSLPYPYEEYKHMAGDMQYYNLTEHLEALYDGLEYNGSYSGVSSGTYIETDDSINWISYPYGTGIEMIKPLRKNNQWIKIEWEYINSTTGNLETHNTSAKVIGEENITVKAGNFNAYKIQVDYNWPDLNYTVIAKYEYYVPNVGLVLEEWDRINHIAYFNNGNTTTIVVREVGRNELVSYNIIK